MKKISNSLMSAILLVSVVVLVLVFSKTNSFVYAAGSAPFEYQYEDINSGMESTAQYFGSKSDAEIEYFIDNNVGMSRAAFESYKAVKDTGIGDFVSVERCDIEEYDDCIVAQSVVHFKKSDVKLVAKFQPINDDVIPVDISFTLIQDEKSSGMGAKMGKAGMNTLMGMGTVFIVLIFLSFVISLFGIINSAQKKKSDVVKNDVKTTEEDEAEEELVDDLELVAVITAAIAASQGGSSDGFVVRSIRRRTQNKWKSA